MAHSLDVLKGVDVFGTRRFGRRCVLIGDNPESDIAGAKGVGMRTILTLSGIISAEDVPNIPASRKPDAIIQDLRDLATVPV